MPRRKEAQSRRDVRDRVDAGVGSRLRVVLGVIVTKRDWHTDTSQGKWTNSTGAVGLREPLSPGTARSSF